MYPLPPSPPSQSKHEEELYNMQCAEMWGEKKPAVPAAVTNTTAAVPTAAKRKQPDTPSTVQKAKRPRKILETAPPPPRAPSHLSPVCKRDSADDDLLKLETLLQPSSPSTAAAHLTPLDSDCSPPSKPFCGKEAAAALPVVPKPAILRGKRVALSGYSAALKEALGENVRAMGGSTVPAGQTQPPPDIIVCETLTQAQEQYTKAGLGDRIVTRQFILDCDTLSKQCDMGHYRYTPRPPWTAAKPQAQPRPQPVIVPRLTAQAEQRLTAMVSVPSSDAMEDDEDDSVPVKAPSTLECPQVFQDCSIYLHSEDPKVEKNVLDQLERHIIAHDGDVVTSLDEIPTHVVTLSTGAAFEHLLETSPHLCHISATPNWVWNSIEAQCKLDISAFAPDL